MTAPSFTAPCPMCLAAAPRGSCPTARVGAMTELCNAERSEANPTERAKLVHRTCGTGHWGESRVRRPNVQFSRFESAAEFSTTLPISAGDADCDAAPRRRLLEERELGAKFAAHQSKPSRETVRDRIRDLERENLAMSLAAAIHRSDEARLEFENRVCSYGDTVWFAPTARAAEARQWFVDGYWQCPFAFRSVCDLLVLDAETLLLPVLDELRSTHRTRRPLANRPG